MMGCGVRLLVVAAMFVALSAPVRGGADSGRFVLKKVEDGFLRLDTGTGAVSHCAPKSGQWVCTSLADDVAALQRQVENLKRDNARLRKKLDRLQADARGDGAKPARPNLPSDEELDRMLGFFERLLDRFMKFARRLNRAPGEDI